MIRFMFMAVILLCLAIPWIVFSIVGALIADAVVIALIFFIDWLFPEVNVQPGKRKLPDYRTVFRYSKTYKKYKT